MTDIINLVSLALSFAVLAFSIKVSIETRVIFNKIRDLYQRMESEHDSN